MLKKSKKQPVPKDCITRAHKKLDIFPKFLMAIVEKRLIGKKILHTCFKHGFLPHKIITLHSSLEKTPTEMIYNEKLNLSSVKLFGSSAVLNIEMKFHKKLNQTTTKRTVLESSDNIKCYLIGFEDNFESRETIKFNE